MRRRLSNLLLLCLLVATQAGCLVAYRAQFVDDEVHSKQGLPASVEGVGHFVELSLVLDFRYLRILYPYVGGTYELDATDANGGTAHLEHTREFRAFGLQVPMLSVWNEDEGFTPDYPGTMRHRTSVELYAGGLGHFGSSTHLWADLGVHYYQHNLFSAGVFAGWGGLPLEAQTRLVGPSYADFEFYDTIAGGPTMGASVTILAGEQALDFLTFFGESNQGPQRPIR